MKLSIINPVALGAAVLCASVSPAGASLIADWNFDNLGSSPGNPQTVNASSFSSSVNATPTATATAPAGGSISRVAGNPSSGFAIQINPGAGNANNMLFTLTLTANTSITISGLSYDYQTSSGENGKQDWTYSINGGSKVSYGSQLNWNASYVGGWTSLSESGSITLSAGQTIVLTDTYNGAAAGGFVDFDNLAITGVPVPEPVTCALALFGLIAGAAGAGRVYLRHARA